MLNDKVHVCYKQREALYQSKLFQCSYFLLSYFAHPTSKFVSKILPMVEVTVKQVNALPNTIDVVITGETHTAASAIVERLNADAACEYAAYKVGHPTDNFVTIRIKGDEHRSAKEILKNSIRTIIRDIDSLIEQMNR